MRQELQTLLSHETTEWYTPPEIIAAAKEALGGIDLDPASSDMAQRIVQAEQYYTLKENGLLHPWYGRVWLNPPYSKTGGKSNQEIFAQKLIREYRAGNVTEALLLTKSSLGYCWFEAVWDAAPAVCFMRDLVSFLKPDLTPGGKAKLGSAIFYFGSNLTRFSEVFSSWGRVIAAVNWGGNQLEPAPFQMSLITALNGDRRQV